jgi:hypothetical protein
MVDAGGRIQGVSVNAAPGVSVQELTAPNRHTEYPGIPHNQVGVTTGAILSSLSEATELDQIQTR